MLAQGQSSLGEHGEHSQEGGKGRGSIEGVSYVPRMSQLVVSSVCHLCRGLHPGPVLDHQCPGTHGQDCPSLLPQGPSQSQVCLAGGSGQHSLESDRDRPAAHSEPVILTDQPAGEKDFSLRRNQHGVSLLCLVWSEPASQAGLRDGQPGAVSEGPVPFQVPQLPLACQREAL